VTLAPSYTKGTETRDGDRPTLASAQSLAARTLPPERIAAMSARATVAPGRRAEMVLPTPWETEPLGTVRRSTPDDVRYAAELARQAQAAWAERPLKERAKVLLRLHDLVLRRQSEALDLIQLESGKSRGHAFEEVADTAIVSRYYARSAHRHLASKRRLGALPLITGTVEHFHPRGIVGIIAPWNYPLSMGITDALPALVAGNAVLIKPDAQTTLTGLWIATLLDEAGLPRDLLHVLPGRGSDLGEPILDEVDFLCFTGSTTTGRLIATKAAQRLVGCSLELGGKNAMIVLEDADLDAAVHGAIRGCFASAGQLCISLERIYVHDSLFDEFTRRLARAASSLRLGIGLDWTYEIGSLVSSSQLETVRRHVEDAVEKGATVLAGGQHRPDIGRYVFEPTVLADVTPDMEAHSCETFGPVVSLYPVANEAEAIARANDTEYGLNASVYTRDIRRGRRIAARLRAGTVNINEAYAATWASVDAPMGGWGDSGLGRRHGSYGVLKYTEPQTVAVQRFHPIAAPWFMSNETYAKLLTGALHVLRRIPGRG